MITSSETRVPPGTVLRGKWNGRTYRLERMLGIGANGQVYLAVSGLRTYALKIGMQLEDLQAEANVLASLDQRERKRPPFLLDVDDAEWQGRLLPFYVMQYIPGVPVKTYLAEHGSAWYGVVGYRLLNRLAELHAAGWVFGDVKSDNILVTDYGRVSLVDYGGMTAMGRSVRQFTEVYDRGYWSAGSRTADPAYDVFSAAVLWIHALDGKRLLHMTKMLLPQNRHPRELMALVRSHAELKTMESWMERALYGKFKDAREASDHWRERMQAAAKDALQKSRGKVPGWMAGLFAASLLLCVSAAAFWLLQ